MATKFRFSKSGILTIMILFVSFSVSVRASEISSFSDPDYDEPSDPTTLLKMFGCKKASVAQIAVVNQGNLKLQKFLRECSSATNNSSWCSQLTRPNPSSTSIFQCTYGANQPHTLIHPDEGTWSNAFKAVQLVEDLQTSGIKPCHIYNWWRPEPYNQNVGGAPGRHPYGTSIDVRFCSMSDMEKAFLRLCKWRSQGRLRALGYYGSTGLHFGIGDLVGNTWGKSCP